MKECYEISKEFEISCSHRLNSPRLTPGANLLLFGKCNNLPSHGHNYKIILYLRARLDYQTGMVRNFNDVKKVFNNVIDERFDHKFLNEDALFKNICPTAENMCQVFFNLLKPGLPELYRIQIWETSDASASYWEEKE